MRKTIAQQLGAKIARDIFAYGEDRYRVPIKRIALVAGEWPHDESLVCGLMETALADLIGKRIAHHMSEL